MMNLNKILELVIINNGINNAEGDNEIKENSFPQSELIDSIITGADATKVDDLKKLFAAAQKIAQEKGLAPKLTTTATAIASDTVITRAQLAWRLANREISVDDIAETIADKATTYIETVARKVATTENIKMGLNMLINVVKTKFPAAEAIRPYADKFAEWAGPKVQNAITESMPFIKKAISSTVKSAGKVLASVATKAKEKISRIFSWA